MNMSKSKTMLEKHHSMPIAIIGIACRFPGDATSPKKLWDMLMRKESARRDTPPDRWNMESFYHPDGDRRGTVNNCGGHFLSEDIAAFDAPFFSISPAEAIHLDPMQRLLLEVAYEATEAAGLPISSISGSKASCYVGCFTSDYDELRRRDPELSSKHTSVGTGQSMLANRISHFFNLKGPSMTVDTACSSSLVAVHLACQSLRTGESNMAIVGASNAIIAPTMQIAMSNMHFLSPDSTCYAFDERANGYARGEGVAAIILKPLDSALRDNDPIRAIIRGTAVNSDGRTPGITMPSKDAQVSLIRSAYENAGCDFGLTGYFEAHGTGTPAGDPIEASAVGEIFASHRPIDRNGSTIPLYIGSIKTNIGHLEGASGLAGFIKAALCVEKGIIAPNLWFEKGNPAIDFGAWRIQVPTEAITWPVPGLRRASLNSSGYGGTNTHVILEEVEHYLGPHSQGRDRSLSIWSGSDSSNHENSCSWDFVENLTPSTASTELSLADPQNRVFVISAHDKGVLQEIAKKYAESLQDYEGASEGHFLDDLAYTLCDRRSIHTHRTAIVASSLSEFTRKIQNGPVLRTHTTPPQIGFIFTGQGAQWWAMGRKLLQYPVFKASIIACGLAVRSFGADWSLLDELQRHEKDSRVGEAAISQPLGTALQLALVDLFASWNIHPECVVGHSSGEIAAAYAIDALTLESAMKVAYFRGLVSANLKELGYDGSMLAVGLSRQDAQAAIDTMDKKIGQVVIACVNSPRSVTMSGDTPAIDELRKTLTVRGVFARKLQVDIAYHSHHMYAVSEEYASQLSDLAIAPRDVRKNVKMFSSVLGNAVESEQLSARYWVKNLVSCVHFSNALKQLCAPNPEGYAVTTLIEIGPHATLAGPVKQTLTTVSGLKPSSRINYLAALYRGKDAALTVLEVAASLFCEGCPVALRTVNFPFDTEPAPSVLMDLPPYPWNHSRTYWKESRLSKDYRFRPFIRSDILGAPVSDWNPIEPRWRNLIRLDEQPWIKGHVIQGTVLFPAAGYCCMAIEAMAQMNKLFPSLEGHSDVEYRLRNVNFSRALLVPDTEDGVEVVFTMRPQPVSSISSSDNWKEFRIFSMIENREWLEHCRGLVATFQCHTKKGPHSNVTSRWTEAREKCTIRIDRKEFYAATDAVGLHSDLEFQGLLDISACDGQAVGVVQVTDTRSGMPKQYEYPRILHPTTMDSIMQLTIAATCGGNIKDFKTASVPTFIEGLCIAGNINARIGRCFNAIAQAWMQGSRDTHADIVAFDRNSSNTVVRMDGLKCTAIKPLNGQNSNGVEEVSVRKHCFRVVWEPDIALLDKQKLNQTLREASPGGYKTRVKDLELVAYYYIDRILREVHTEEVPNMLPHHQRLYVFFEQQRELVRRKQHEYQTMEWSHLDDTNVSARIRELIQEYSSNVADFEGRMFVRMGEALPSVFRQEVDALGLMMQDNLLYNHYSVGVGVKWTYPQLARYIALASHKDPNLSYLEIGAGTGGVTLPILEALGGCKKTRSHPKLKSYMYTDISTGFFERAREMFKQWEKFIEFKKLDIEQDPNDQDFIDAQFDIIIAANVLHATTDIHQTLKHVRKLLKLGGKLILLELTHSRLFMSIIAGALPGWWNASEKWRLNGPVLSNQQWEDVLSANGFSSLEASAPDVPIPSEECTRVMVAAAVEKNYRADDALTDSVTSHHRTIIIPPEFPTEDGDQIVASLLPLLKQTGLTAQISTLLDLKDSDLRNTTILSLVELHDSVLYSSSPDTLRIIQRMANDLTDILWVTCGANSTRPVLSLFQGLARTLRSEHRGFRCITLDLDGGERIAPTQAAALLHRVYQHVFGSKEDRTQSIVDFEFVDKYGVLQIKRAIEDHQMNNFIASRTNPHSLSPESTNLIQAERNLVLKIRDTGNLSSFVWDNDASSSNSLGPDDVEILVQAAGLNLNDILAAQDQATDTHLGSECSGLIIAVGNNVSTFSVGDWIVAWSLGCFSTRVKIPARFVQKIPDTMTFATASSLPSDYVTAYYAVVQIAQLNAGERILIRLSTDSVSQATIQIAQMIGAEVFVSVNCKEKKTHLIHTYVMKDSHIFFDHDMEFVDKINQATNGVGVDVILNDVSNEASHLSWKSIAPFGRFIDLRKQDTQAQTSLEIGSMTKNVMFTAVDITLLFRKKAELASKILALVMDLIRTGKLQPVSPIFVEPWSKLNDCIEQVKEKDHIGKVVLDFTAAIPVPVIPKSVKQIKFSSDASYVLSGGLGGLGRSISKWMVRNGAKHFVFVSRSGVSTQAATFLNEIRKFGAQAAVIECDIADEEKLSTELDKALTSMPPLRGVIQAAMVLHDRMFSNLTTEKFHSVLRPKVQGSWALHKATLERPLDFFVLLASVASFVGNVGQSNYAAACAYQVALSSYRRSLGLPATALDLGKVADVGYIAEKAGTRMDKNVGFIKLLELRENEMLAVMEAAMLSPSVEVISNGYMVTGLHSNQTVVSTGSDAPVYMQDPVLSHLAHHRPHIAALTQSQSSQEYAQIPLSTLLSRTLTFEDARSHILDSLSMKLSRLLMMKLEDVDVTRPTSAYGVDSLVAVEVKNWLFRETGAALSVFDILQATCIMGLSEKVANQSPLFRK